MVDRPFRCGLNIIQNDDAITNPNPISTDMPSNITFASGWLEQQRFFGTIEQSRSPDDSHGRYSQMEKHISPRMSHVQGPGR